MNKQNNCQCVVCNVEQSLLDSLSTQTARTHFKALANSHPVLNHLESPLDVVTKLRRQGERGRGEVLRSPGASTNKGLSTRSLAIEGVTRWVTTLAGLSVESSAGPVKRSSWCGPKGINLMPQRQVAPADENR